MGCGESTTKDQNQRKAETSGTSNSNQPKPINEHHEPKPVGKPEVIFVVGGPGSGKGTQCENIVKTFGYSHLSTGDLLREEKKKGGQLADEINKIMISGGLVPTSILIKLLKNAMLKIGWNKKFLIDGFPRNQENVDVWKKEIGDSAWIRFVLYFNVSEEVMKERLIKRGETSGRSDDNEAAIMKRFTTFRQESLPIIEVIRSEGRLREIDSGLTKEEVFESVRELFLMPKVVFVVGGPGSGKGTQCANLVSEFGFAHLSTGDLLRKERDSGSDLAEEINRIMESGGLVSTEILLNLVLNEMREVGWDRIFLLDGFPRSKENLDLWEKKVADKVDLLFVLYFELDEETMRQRLLKRGETSGRSDDNAESIIKRFKTFQEQSVPIIKLFEAEGMLRTINSKAAKDEVFVQVKNQFKGIC